MLSILDLYSLNVTKNIAEDMLCPFAIVMIWGITEALVETP